MNAVDRFQELDRIEKLTKVRLGGSIPKDPVLIEKRFQ
jgi:hypothetical protein